MGSFEKSQAHKSWLGRIFARVAVWLALASAGAVLVAAPSYAQAIAPAEQVSVSYVANTQSSIFTEGWSPDLNQVVAKLLSGWSSFYGACSAVSTTGARQFVDKGWSVNGKWASRYWSSTVGLVKTTGCGSPDGPDYPARTWEFPITKWEYYGCASGSIKVPVVTDVPMCEGVAPPVCPVAPLLPITDPLALEHEFGQYSDKPDLERLTPQVRNGAACILQKSATLKAGTRISSGHRPHAYQAHLRELWDKWQLLKKNTSESCRLIKADVYAQWLHHELVRRPVENSNHSVGKAVDIKRVPAASADQIAEQCGMYRPEPGRDPVHFQAR